VSHQPFAQGHGGGEGRRSKPPDRPKIGNRPEDIPDRPVSLRRIGRLFIPYRLRLGLLLGLIVVGSILSVASPFLLREALDGGILKRNLTLLSWMVGGMIALAIVNGVIGVAQTWISNQVGQRVMHDLRAAVYAHLQRMSLAFFTRTRSGEIQARIAYDIGGIDNVVTSTATSTVSTVATVAATVVAMFALNWRLTVFSLILLPFFVWLTRRVGNERRRILSVRQGRLADMSTLVEESLSVSGILLGKTMGRSHELVDRFSSESSELADLEVRARMAGRWRMASVQMSFAIMPAAVYWFAGYNIAHGHNAISIGTVVAFTTLQTRLLFPMQQLLSVGLEVQTSLALFGRIFEYLDLSVDIVERPGARPSRRCSASASPPMSIPRRSRTRWKSCRAPVPSRTWGSWPASRSRRWWWPAATRPTPAIRWRWGNATRTQSAARSWWSRMRGPRRARRSPGRAGSCRR
jgi:ATP-binding cassette subfamily B protein